MEKNLFSPELYNRLPRFYHRYDNGDLQKYIETLCEYGYGDIIDSINEFTNYIDPEKCPVGVLPIFCKCFEVPFSPDIDPKYIRKLLSNLGELRRRRGSLNCIRFLVRVLTGLEISVVYAVTTGLISLSIKVITLAQITEQAVSQKVIKFFIANYLPYTVRDVEILIEVGNVVLPSEHFIKTQITMLKREVITSSSTV